MLNKKRLWSYENKMVAICMLCFGFVMLDRFAVANLAPFIMDDLHMTNTDLGLVMAAVSLSWAFSGYFGSMLSDLTANKKRILCLAVLLFSACSFLTGLAASFLMLLAIRFFMGIFEGPVFPVAQAFALAQSSPERRGLNMGLISTTSMGLIASLLGAIGLVALAQALGWRITFSITLIPGLVLVYLVVKVLKEPDMTNIAGTAAKGGKPSLRESLVIFKNRNMITSMVFSCFIISWNVGTLTFAPVYLVAVKHLSPATMSYIVAVFGLGAIVWGVVVPGISDKVGRKPMVILFSLLSMVAPLGLILSSSPVVMGACVFIGWSASGVFPLYQAAILGESVDTKYASTAIAGVQMTGEIGGSVIGVAVAGKLADLYGLQAALLFTAGCILVATIIGFAYYETAPLVLARRKASKK